MKTMYVDERIERVLVRRRCLTLSNIQNASVHRSAVDKNQTDSLKPLKLFRWRIENRNPNDAGTKRIREFEIISYWFDHFIVNSPFNFHHSTKLSYRWKHGTLLSTKLHYTFYKESSPSSSPFFCSLSLSLSFSLCLSLFLSSATPLARRSGWSFNEIPA